MVGTIFHPLWNNCYSLTGLLVRPTQICNNNNTLATNTHHSTTCYGSRVPTGLGSILYSTFTLCSNPGPHPMPVSAHPAHVSSSVSSLFLSCPSWAPLYLWWLLILSLVKCSLSSYSLSIWMPTHPPEWSEIQPLQDNCPATSVSRFWSFQTAQIKNPAWALFFLLTPDSWGPLCTNGGSYREVCVC